MEIPLNAAHLLSLLISCCLLRPLPFLLSIPEDLSSLKALLSLPTFSIASFRSSVPGSPPLASVLDRPSSPLLESTHQPVDTRKSRLESLASKQGFRFTDFHDSLRNSRS